MPQTNFHSQLKKEMDEFIHQVYALTKIFPKEELYGVTSQIRRAALSVILNYIEGRARFNSKKNKTFRNFIEISYGSLQETKYLLEFSRKENYISEVQFMAVFPAAEKVGAKLWGILRNTQND